ncbi:MAG: STAS/SEC14 domain-containing protein [Anaerolineae bacterium]|nr:STAS/SEC14 domain-containing protein [Anaerolineae bacterium]
MGHEVYMGEDGILRVRFIGDIGEQEITAFLAEFTPYLEASTPERPLRVLALPAPTPAKFSSHARKVLASLNTNPKLGKSATVDTQRYTRVLLSFVLKATGRSNIAIFNTEEEALAWLQKD